VPPPPREDKNNYPSPARVARSAGGGFRATERLPPPNISLKEIIGGTKALRKKARKNQPLGAGRGVFDGSDWGVSNA
jgi:hypothetical protein